MQSFTYSSGLGGGTHAFLGLVRGEKQRRRLLAAQRHLARGCQIIEDVTVLLPQGGHDGHHRFDEPGALRTVGPTDAFAPEDAGAYSALSRVVRGLPLGMTHERPHCLAQLEDLPAATLGFRYPIRLTRCPQPLHLAPDRPK
jgi:hypothetical protein